MFYSTSILILLSMLPWSCLSMCFPTTSGPGADIDARLLLADQSNLAQSLSQAHDQGRARESFGGDLKYKLRDSPL